MAPRPVTLPALVDLLQAARQTHDPARALLIGLSGIDGAGKGWVARQLQIALTERGFRLAVLSVDDWLNLPHVRFAPHRPALHFYTHALRLEDFRATLLQPLQATRSVDVVTDFAEETATSFRQRRYRFQDIDIVLAEGIYLFKTAMRDAYDLAVWVDCPFDTALARAIVRAQEGLPPEATIEAYRTIYFPAQHHHFRVDQPRDGADYTLPNGEAVV
jgi:uridine kinase